MLGPNALLSKLLRLRNDLVGRARIVHDRIRRNTHATLRRDESASLLHLEAVSVDDGLAVLGLTCLKVGCVDARFDEIAFGIDAQERQGLAADLPADNERGVESDLLQVIAVASLDIAHHVRDQHREHGACTPEIQSGAAVTAPLVQRDSPPDAWLLERSGAHEQSITLIAVQ